MDTNRIDLLAFEDEGKIQVVVIVTHRVMFYYCLLIQP